LEGRTSVVDQLLVFLLEDTRNVSGRMAAAGYSDDEIPGGGGTMPARPATPRRLG